MWTLNISVARICRLFMSAETDVFLSNTFSQVDFLLLYNILWHLSCKQLIQLFRARLWKIYASRQLLTKLIHWIVFLAFTHIECFPDNTFILRLVLSIILFRCWLKETWESNLTPLNFLHILLLISVSLFSWLLYLSN